MGKRLTRKEARRHLWKGSLDLRHTDITELPDHLSIEGCLYLEDSKLAKLPEHLTVGKHLFLQGSRITSLPEYLTVGGYLSLSGTPVTRLSKHLTIGGSLFLEHSYITSLPEYVTIGSSLNLRHTKVTQLSEHLTVRGCLFLPEQGIDRLPKDLTIGQCLYAADTVLPPTSYRTLQQGDYRPEIYLYANHLLTPVRTAKQIGGYTVYIGTLNHRYIVSDGTHYAHCEDIRNGVCEIRFQIAKELGAEQYRRLDQNRPIPLYDAIAMYRVLTGACEQGVRHFLDQQPGLKDTYTVREIIDLTTGWYGSASFRAFFDA